MEPRWCRKCKAVFAAEVCAGNHAAFMYSKKLPPEAQPEPEPEQVVVEPQVTGAEVAGRDDSIDQSVQEEEPPGVPLSLSRARAFSLAQSRSLNLARSLTHSLTHSLTLCVCVCVCVCVCKYNWAQMLVINHVMMTC